MRKLLTTVFIAVFIFSLTATAFAAQTFSDVPAKHWAYEAVAKLAKAGLIEGYGDGTFRGDRSMNRYEFAVLTVRLLDRFDRADEEQKQLIDKLSAEFAAELNRMGARVAKLETKTNTWVVGGDARFRYIRNDPRYPGNHKLQGADQTDWRARLAIKGTINENTEVNARLTSNYGNKFGQIDGSNPGSAVYFDTFNILRTKAFGLDSIRLGRSALDVIGNGLIGNPLNDDGVTVKDTMGIFKFTGFTGNIKPYSTADGMYSGEAQQLTTADFKFKVSDKLTMGIGYYWSDERGIGSPANLGSSQSKGTMLVDRACSFDSSRGFDISVNYTLGGVTLLGDYVSTSLQNATSNLNDSPKAWVIQLSNGKGPGATRAYYNTSWKLVNPLQKGSSAWMIHYRIADPGAMPYGAGGFDTSMPAYVL